ncbi:MAG: hypothetical protein SF097_22385 [Acidobacteriota bacterium]|nr:hypothetical protein [Acidobacteriota bacterium]
MAASRFWICGFQPLIGWLADNFSYAPVFIAVPLLQILAAMAITLFIPRVDLLKN